MARSVKPTRRAGDKIPDRFIPYAYLGPNGFCVIKTQSGSSTFDHIWRQAPDSASWFVMKLPHYNAKMWVVTDRFKGHIPEGQASVFCIDFELFEDLDAAMMAATMKASRGSNRQEFAHLCISQVRHIPTTLSLAEDRLMQLYTVTLHHD